MCFVKIDVESLTKDDEISDRQGIVVRFSGIIRNNGIHTVWGCSSVGRAPALQAGGHGFESHHLHQGTNKADERKQSEYRGDKGTKPETTWAHSSGG